MGAGQFAIESEVPVTLFVHTSNPQPTPAHGFWDIFLLEAFKGGHEKSLEI